MTGRWTEGERADVSLRDAWRRHAAAWAAWAATPGHDVFFWRYNLPAFLGLVPPPGRLTLDVGCGEGRVGRALVALGHRVVGVDAAPVLAASAAAHDEALTVATADAAALPIQAGVADLAVSFMVLQDVDDLEAVVGELARVVEVGGRLCFAIVHPLASAGDFVDADEAAFLIDRAYARPGRFVETVERDGLTMVFHSEHRPLESYFGALERAGFVVEALREPVPDEELLRDVPRMRPQQRIPWFLHVRARRVESRGRPS